MTEGWVDYLTGPWGFPFAFAAGMLSFLSPCCLPLVPAYLAHLTGTTAAADAGAAARRETASHAVAFVFGLAAVFTFIGASAGLLGALLGEDSNYALADRLPLLEKIAGVFLIVMGLNLIGLIRIPWLFRTLSFEMAPGRTPAVAAAGANGGAMTVAGGAIGGQPVRTYVLSYGRSFGVGTAFALGWTPCIGPVLGAILTLSATSASVAKGTYLLLVYSLGLGVPFILTGLAVVPVTAFLRRIRGVLPLVEIVMGVLVVCVGALIFLDELTIFNRYFDFFGLSGI